MNNFVSCGVALMLAILGTVAIAAIARAMDRANAHHLRDVNALIASVVATSAEARPTSPAPEDRLRQIVREEIDDDNALRASRNHAEFLHERERQRGWRPELERKRTPGAADA